MNKRLKNNYIFLLILIPVILRALTPVFFKSAALKIETYNFISIATNLLYWISFILFFLRAVTWQFVLKKVQLSYAYPFTSLSYVFLLLIGYLYFNEAVSVANIAGASLIIIGTIVLAANKTQDG